MIKLLLTGMPGSGKTTTLIEFLEAVPEKQGFITRELRQNGSRTGFELVSSSGQSAILASVSSNSDKRVSKYGVEMEALDDFLTGLPPIGAGKLLYIDEIGQMELFSKKFKALAQDYLEAENTFAGTISSVYKDSFIQEILDRSDIIVIEIAPTSREQIKEVLNSLAVNLKLLASLPMEVQRKITEMAQEYASASAYIQLKKLFGRAVAYTAQSKVARVSRDEFTVKGRHAQRVVLKTTAGWRCDCDLFNGRGVYEGKAGACSHIQSVNLVEISGGRA